MESAPEPDRVRMLEEFISALRSLKIWHGNPSISQIAERIRDAWRAAGRPPNEWPSRATVGRCFATARQRVDEDLVVAVVEAIVGDQPQVITAWRHALRRVLGHAEASHVVTVQDRLPPDLAGFTGRIPELDQLRQALHRARHNGRTVAVSAIEGMAGVGKTGLAVHAGHLLAREKPFDRVLFVNLRGFHPDPGQPPADPAAVLDGFLRLLGVPGQKIPHNLPARTAAYRDRLAGTHTLVVLDNAADTNQVRPLLPDTPGSLTLITSRRSLTDLPTATHLTVDVFTPDEALDFLTGAVPEVAVGVDPHAPARIARRCGYLPLALSLVAGHIRGTPGWTLTDHADRLDERHHHRQQDTDVQLALDLSYQHLPGDRQRLLRLAALHPGQDLDAYAAAALTDTDLDTAQERLHHLCCEHLLQEVTPGRFGFHDLVRAYAADRASDQDPPPQRHTALTRLFDFYLATAATAMDLAYPHERPHRPTVPPAGTPTPDLADRNWAELWLDAEPANLLAAAGHAAALGWAEHTWQLSAVLDRHLRTRGRYQDAQTLHQQALNLAHHLGNHSAEMNALNSLGYVERRLGRYEQADGHFGRALQLAQAIGDRVGEWTALAGLGHVDRMRGRHKQAVDHYGRALQLAQAISDRVGARNALAGLGAVHWMLGRHEQAGDYFGRALQLAQAICDRVGERNALNGLGAVHWMLGRYQQADDHYDRALQLAQAIGDREGELNALNGLGAVHWMLGRHEQASGHFGRALQIAQDIGDRNGELYALHGLGHVHRTLGRHSEAVDCYQQVLDLARELGNVNGQFEALQGLGRLHHATGHSDLALTHHRQALQHAADLAQPADQARAHDGLAHAHHTLNQHDQARNHWQQALDILTSLGTDHTEDIEASVPNIRAHLTSLDQQPATATEQIATSTARPPQ